MTPSIVDLPWLLPPPKDFAARAKAAQADGDGRAIQALATFRLNGRQATGVARALRQARESGRDLAPLAPFRLGVLASATYDMLLDDLVAAAARHGVALELVT